MRLSLHRLQTKGRSTPVFVGFAICLLFVGLGDCDVLHAEAVPHTTTAPDELSVEDVLTKVRTAIGYEQLQRYEAGILVEGDAKEFEVDGKYQLMFTPDGKFLEKVESQFGRTVGFDGKTGWTVDYSEMPRALELAGLEFWQLSIWFYIGRWLAPDNGYVISILDKYTNEKQVALSVKLESGVWEFWLFIDRATWFPTSVLKSWTGTNKGLVMLFEDYRPALGFKFPHRIVKADGEFEVSTINEIPSTRRNAFALVDKMPADARFDEKRPAEIEYKYAKSYHILVRPRVNGRNVGWFVLDCGSGQMMIDAGVADQLNMPSFGKIVSEDDQGATTQTTLRRGRQFELGPITISNLVYCELDLSNLSQKCGYELAGICGYDLFSRSVVEFELQKSAIRIHNPARYSSDGVKWQELFFANRLPCTLCRFEGDREGLFVIDSGFPGCLTFNAPAVDKYKLLDGRKTTTSSSDSFSLLSSRYKVITGGIEWFELGSV